MKVVSKSIAILLTRWALASSMSIFANTGFAEAEQSVQQLFAQGYNQLEARDFASAIKEFKLGLKLEPNNALAHFYLGTAYLGANDAADGEHELRKSLELNLPEPQATTARKALQPVQDVPAAPASSAPPTMAQGTLQKALGDALVVPGVRIGSISIGESTSDLYRTLGDPVFTSGNTYVWTGSLQVSTSDGHVASIETDGPNMSFVHTKENLSYGANLLKVRATLGEPCDSTSSYLGMDVYDGLEVQHLEYHGSGNANAEAFQGTIGNPQPGPDTDTSKVSGFIVIPPGNCPKKSDP